MFEQDPIMRQIHDIIKAAAKMMHMNVDIKSEHLVQIEDLQVQQTTGELLKQLDDGDINEAENKLYEMLEHPTMDMLHAGIAFYAHLDELEDDFLLANDFSREEVEDGKAHLLAVYGLSGMGESFFEA
ncbi:MAG: hypothetical protein E7502_08735 [Ruminococcus sp.]|nr:hypothetical protein [Ruminococcus sp.]